MSKNTSSGAFLVLGACAVLALTFAVGVPVASVAQNSNSSGGMKHDTGAMAADQKFVMEAAMGGLAEVEMGRLAAQKGATDEVRQFGQRMVDDHSKANEELMRVAS